MRLIMTARLDERPALDAKDVALLVQVVRLTLRCPS